MHFQIIPLHWNQIIMMLSTVLLASIYKVGRMRHHDQGNILLQLSVISIARDMRVQLL